jgi:hypothetical protein
VTTIQGTHAAASIVVALLPGFVEVDFVAHAGTSAAGSFVQMVLTGMAAGWTECVPVVVRNGELVIAELAAARGLSRFLCAASTSATTAP